MLDITPGMLFKDHAGEISLVIGRQFRDHIGIMRVKLLRRGQIVPAYPLYVLIRDHTRL
jgi:hypothetical protein